MPCLRSMMGQLWINLTWPEAGKRQVRQGEKDEKE
jgi:hypothetical protein